MVYGRVFLRRILIGVALTIVSLVLFTVQAAPKTITFWHYWQSDEGKALEEVVQDFNKTHKDLQVKVLSAGTYENIHEKLLTAITGGNPPDVGVCSTDYLPEWVYNGALVSLDSYIKKTRFDLSDFYPISLKLATINGKLYGLPLNQDTYALLWNKKLFRKAGLDPEKPPKTIAELDAMAEKLTIKNEKGEIVQLGFLPDWPWSHFPMVAWAFGGTFYNEKTKKITCNDPNTVKALEWEQSYYKKYGLKELNAFKAGLGEYATAGYAFYTGQVAMVIEGEWQPNFIKLYAPKDFEWGAAPFPGVTPELSGQTQSSATCLVIPKGCKNPKEAWQFIAWMERPENAGRFDAAISNVPPFKSLGQDPNYVKDPRFQVFMKLLENPKYQIWPQIPVAMNYMTQLGTAEEHVCVAGDKDPKEALDEVAKAMQAELDKALKKKR